MTPYDAYAYAIQYHKEPGFNLTYCQEAACKQFDYAYYFARDVPGANIEYCQERACKSFGISYWFARDVPGADISYCRKACGKNKSLLKMFDKMIIKKAML